MRERHRERDRERDRERERREEDGSGTFVCSACAFLMSGTFAHLHVYIMSDLLLVRCAGVFLSLTHLSVHRFLDTPMFALFCFVVCRRRLGLR